MILRGLLVQVGAIYRAQGPGRDSSREYYLAPGINLPDVLGSNRPEVNLSLFQALCNVLDARRQIFDFGAERFLGVQRRGDAFVRLRHIER